MKEKIIELLCEHGELTKSRIADSLNMSEARWRYAANGKVKLWRLVI